MPYDILDEENFTMVELASTRSLSIGEFPTLLRISILKVLYNNKKQKIELFENNISLDHPILKWGKILPNQFFFSRLCVNV